MLSSSLVLTALMSLPLSAVQQNEVKISRDQFGIAHIRANTDEGAFYGAGLITAQDRWFQMCFERLRGRGRLAEFFGAGQNDAYLDSDKRARLIDWVAQADYAVSAMDQAHLDLLQSYCDGVNRGVFGFQPFIPLFDAYQVPKFDAWTPQDCLIVWMILGDLYTDDGTGEVLLDSIFDPNNTDQENLLALFRQTQVVNHAATIQPGDYTGDLNAIDNYVQSMGVNQYVRSGMGTYVPHFSEALAVLGSAVEDHGTAADSMLWGAPRVPVSFPGPFYEWHMKGETFDVRGAGVPGSPNLLFGSTHHEVGEEYSWSLTAAGTDMGDLFKLTLVPFEGGTGYSLNGLNRGFSPDRDETILIKDTPGDTNSSFSSEVVRRRGTHFGPVITEVLGTTDEYALSYVPVQRFPAPSVVDPFVGILAMYRANDLSDFWDALGDYTFPSVNLVFAGSNDSIGYTVTGAVPVRANGEQWAGIIPMEGNNTAIGWQEYVPEDFRPRVDNPAAGYVYNGNSLPIGSWYPLLCYYRGIGDSFRSFQLRKLMEDVGNYTTAEIRDLFKDRGRENIRSVVRLALVGRDQLGFNYSLNATRALNRLETWYNLNAGLDGLTQGSVIAHFTPSDFGSIPSAPATVLDRYGARDYGLLNMLVEVERGYDATPLSRFPKVDELETLELLLEEGWVRSRAAFTGPPSTWPQQYVDQFLTFGSDHSPGSNVWSRTNQLPKRRAVAFLRSPLPENPLVEPPSNPDPLNPSNWVLYGPVVSPNAATLADVPNSCYNQFVQMGVTDGAESTLGAGPSENPGSPFYSSGLVRMANGELKLSPQSDAGLLSIGVDFNNPDLSFQYP